MSDFDDKSGIVSMVTPWGKWYQSVADVSVEVELEPGTVARDVKVEIKTTSVLCKVKGEVVFQGQWFDKIVEDESTWTIEDKKILRIYLVKVSQEQMVCPTFCLTWKFFFRVEARHGIIGNLFCRVLTSIN